MLEEEELALSEAIVEARSGVPFESVVRLFLRAVRSDRVREAVHFEPWRPDLYVT